VRAGSAGWLGSSAFEAGVAKTVQLRIRSDEAMALNGLVLLFDYDSDHLNLDSFESLISTTDLDVELSGLYDGEGSFCFSQFAWSEETGTGLNSLADEWLVLGNLVFTSNVNRAHPIFTTQFAKIADSQWSTYHVSFDARSIPEPNAMLLLFTGLAVLAIKRFRRR